MADVTLPETPFDDRLAELIRLAEGEVSKLNAVYQELMDRKERPDVHVALTAREELVVGLGQLSGLRMAWMLSVGVPWVPEHPDLQVMATVSPPASDPAPDR